MGVIYLNFPSSSSRTEPNRDLEGDARSRLGEEAAQSRFDLGENAPARSRSRSRPSIKIAFGLGSGPARFIRRPALSKPAHELMMNLLSHSENRLLVCFQ